VALRSLEQQMLEEVRDARLFRALVPRSGPNPEAQGDRTHRGHGLGDDSKAALELGEADAVR
jgi:hypothetical protein